jgi:hypothetical protein
MRAREAATARHIPFTWEVTVSETELERASCAIARPEVHARGPYDRVDVSTT